jgi:hypothetical protein
MLQSLGKQRDEVLVTRSTRSDKLQVIRLDKPENLRVPG